MCSVCPSLLILMLGNGGTSTRSIWYRTSSVRDPFMREALFSVIPIFVNWSIEAPRMIATNSAGVNDSHASEHLSFAILHPRTL